MLKPIYQTTRGKLMVKIFIYYVSSGSKMMCNIRVYNIVQGYGMRLIVLQFV